MSLPVVKLIRPGILWKPGPVAQPRTSWRLKDGSMYSDADGADTHWLEKTGKRTIQGVASTGTVNSHKYSMDPRGCEIKFPIPLLFAHGQYTARTTKEIVEARAEEARIGEIVLVRRSSEQIFVRGVLDDTLAGDAAWKLILSGEARCFSGAGKDMRLRGVVDGIRYYDCWKLYEVSVCRRGANPDCHFEIATSNREEEP